MDLRDDAELMMRHCAHAWRQGVEGIGSEAFFKKTNKYMSPSYIIKVSVQFVNPKTSFFFLP